MVNTQQTVSKGGGEPALPSQFGGNKERRLNDRGHKYKNETEIVKNITAK